VTARFFFIVDRDAPGPTSGGWWSALLHEVRRRGIDAEFELTQGPRTATSFVRQALRAGAETIVAVGSDAVAHDAFNGFFLQGVPVREDARFAMVPVGAPSAFARSLNVPIGLDALGLLTEPQVIEVDVGRVDFADAAGPTSRFFIATVCIGLANQPRLPRGLPGSAARLSALATVLRPEGFRGGMAVDDGPSEMLDAGGVVVALGPYGPGGFEMLPGAKQDDGVLNAAVLGRADALILARSAAAGGGPPISRAFTAHNLRFEPAGAPTLLVDGLEVGQGRAEVRVVAGGMRVVVGRP